MSYTLQTWTDNDPTTPLSGARLTHMEAGIQSANVTTVPIQGSGIDTTGATDSASAIQTIINGAAGQRVYFPPGTYKINSQITIPAGTKICGAGMDLVTIDGTGITNQTAFFKATGTLTGTTSNLSADATALGLTATVASATGFAAGDYVRIESTTSTGSDGILAGEILRIYSISSNTLTFDSALHATYTTAASGKVTKITFCDGVQVEDMGFLGTVNDATKQQIGIEFDFCRLPMVRRVRVQHCHRYGVELWNCLAARVEDSDFYHCSDATYGYAVCNDGATQGSVVTRNNFHTVKAAIEHTGSTGAGNGGVARHCVFSNNVITGAYRGAMQSHTGAEHLDFIGNTVNSTTSNEIGGGQVDGMNIWGTSMVISGNTFNGMFRRCIYIGNGTNAPLRALITGNTCNGASLGVNYGSGLEFDVSSTSNGTVESVVISGNQLKMNTSQNSYGSIRIIGPASGTASGWVITGNDLISSPQYPAILSNNLSSFSITGNHMVVNGTGSNGVGIQIDNSADGAIGNNTIIGPTGGTAPGIQAANTTDVTCIGNRIKGFAAPITTTGTSARWTVGGGSFNGNTSTTVTLAGTGNSTTGGNV